MKVTPNGWKFGPTLKPKTLYIELLKSDQGRNEFDDEIKECGVNR